MPRRASSGPKPGLLIGIAIVLVIAFVGGKFILGERSVERPSGSPLKMGTFTENGNSLRGNEYVVEGRIDDKLHWTPDRGQVVSLAVDDAGTTEFIAIKIPPNLSDINIEREQNYAFKVSFHQGGIAIAEEITRL